MPCEVGTYRYGLTVLLVAWIGLMVWVFVRGPREIEWEARIVIWLLFALFAFAAILNYDTGRDLRRICRVLASHDVELQEIQPICTRPG